jgi:rhodanese-related sulfurtransferase/DNA-binding transcriptional ArsR family regulator
MTDEGFHHPNFDELADLARSLGHTHRLVLLHHVAEGEKPVERLAELSSLTLANASQHLQHLKRAGFVQTRRDGKRVLYRLGNGPIADLLKVLRKLAAHRRDEIRQLLTDSVTRPDSLEHISREELVRRLQDEAVVLLDVRPEVEFAAGHLPGAINIPVAELEGRLAELPRDREIVAYCRGVHCVLSADALAILRQRGRSARHFATGFAGWQAAGLRVERRTRRPSRQGRPKSRRSGASKRGRA